MWQQWSRNSLGHGVKTHVVYAATIKAGQKYTDQTGWFPVVSNKGNKYNMVLYEYYDNAIMAEPIKNRAAMELLPAFQVTEQTLISRGLKPRLVRLDNEAWQ
jgi:hypothetical protein